MSNNFTTTHTLTAKAAAKQEDNLFDHFCELMLRVLLALEEEELAANAGWHMICHQPYCAEVDAAWKLVALQADVIAALKPRSANEKLLHRMAVLMSCAVTAECMKVLAAARSHAVRWVMRAQQDISPAVLDLADEGRLGIEQMLEHASARSGDNKSTRHLPLAA
ncbi:conserved hypothetical protein [Roseovarius sp. EC-HK134]|uniref:hypothetical protein n=1 Tax=unclassified Roseovarius TaxID=2614913 RepID=UPI001258F218|nr:MULTISPECIES: hypothetical protein [unclassified Roseovarius]VVT33143.1 conserved hypothetical protein [Roseovarius sp. EC-SD190]VVT33179.1 conserved hypothetical protein [Roseovarius sp. EC-HK134]